MTILTSIEALRRHAPVFIYGCGVFGRAIRQLLTSNGGFQINGFIDSKLSGEVEGVRCYSLDEYASIHENDHQILICTQAYREIAASLNGRGIHDFWNLWPMLQIFQYRPDIEVRRFAERFLRRGATVLDVGSNIGVFAAFFAGRARQVFAFEPNPLIQDIWANNLRGYNHVERLATAVSDHKGVVTFHADQRNPEGSSSSIEAVPGFEGQLVTVDCTTIDAFCAERNITPDFIKLDVEGHEPRAINGALETIRRCRPYLVFEFPATWWDEGYREAFEKLHPDYHLIRLRSDISGVWRESPIDVSTFRQDDLDGRLLPSDEDAYSLIRRLDGPRPPGRVISADSVTNIGCIPRA